MSNDIISNFRKSRNKNEIIYSTCRIPNEVGPALFTDIVFRHLGRLRLEEAEILFHPKLFPYFEHHRGYKSVEEKEAIEEELAEMESFGNTEHPEHPAIVALYHYDGLEEDEVYIHDKDMVEGIVLKFNCRVEKNY